MRIARELHDTLGQSLALLRLASTALIVRRPAVKQFAERLSGLRALVMEFGRDLNWLAWEIRPTTLDDLGIQTAIQNLTETWTERTGIQVDLHLTLEGERLPPEVETALYRVLQEALTNVIRHAEATLVGVALGTADRLVTMIIEDNGRGFDIGAAGAGDVATKRLGLLGMRERLTLVQGSLEIEFRAWQGHDPVHQYPVDVMNLEPPNRLRVFVADDHPLILDGIKALVSADPALELVGEARDGLTALRLALELKPAVAVLDLSMPGLNGIEVSRRLLAACPECRILILTVHEDDGYLRKLLSLGVAGYI